MRLQLNAQDVQKFLQGLWDFSIHPAEPCQASGADPAANLEDQGDELLALVPMLHGRPAWRKRPRLMGLRSPC